MIQNSVTMNTLLGYQSRVSTIRRQVNIFFLVKYRLHRRNFFSRLLRRKYIFLEVELVYKSLVPKSVCNPHVYKKTTFYSVVFISLVLQFMEILIFLRFFQSKSVAKFATPMYYSSLFFNQMLFRCGVPWRLLSLSRTSRKNELRLVNVVFGETDKIYIYIFGLVRTSPPPSL